MKKRWVVIAVCTATAAILSSGCSKSSSTSPQNNVPATPTLVAPSNGATGVATPATLEWQSVSGATTYGVQLSTASSFATTLVNETGLTAARVTVNGLAGGTTYFWHAEATNSAGTSAWSGVWSFTVATVIAPPGVPVLTSPTNGASDQPVSLTLAWGTVNMAALYGVRLSTSSAFATTLAESDSLISAMVGVSGLDSSTAYFWQVRAVNSAGASAWSGAWKFSTIGPLSTAPALVSPTNGATGQPIVLTLSWNSVAGASSYGVQVSTGSAFASTVFSQKGLSVTSAPVLALGSNTTFFWRANASNSVTSPWSGVWSFATGGAGPTAPALASPTNGATGQPHALTLSWNSVTGATSYGVQVSTASGFSTTVSGQTGLSTTSAPVTALGSNSTYYWRANASNSGTGLWSSIWSFITGP